MRLVNAAKPLMQPDFKRHSVPPPRTGLVEAYRARKPRVLVVGDLMLDRYLWGSTGRISPEAPVPVVDVQKQSCRLGGAGNVLENLITFGADASIVSVVGDGPGRSTLGELVEGLGVNGDGLFSDPSRSVTEKTRIIAGSQQVLRYDLETRQAISPELERRLLEYIERVVDGFHVIAVSDYNKGVLTDTFTQGVISIANLSGVPVVCDPKGNDFSKYRSATLITPNRSEAALATGIQIAGGDRAAVQQAGAVGDVRPLLRVEVGERERRDFRLARFFRHEQVLGGLAAPHVVAVIELHGHLGIVDLPTIEAGQGGQGELV